MNLASDPHSFSVPSNTLLVSPSTYLGHLTLFDVMDPNGECVCVCVCVPLSQSFNFLKVQNDRLQHNFIESNYLQFFLRLI